MQGRKVRIILDTWIARIGAVFGWFCLVMWALVGIVGLTELPEAKRSIDYSAPFICFGLAAVHWPLIRAMKRTRSLVGDFRLYSSVLAKDPDKDIAGIAKTLKIPEDQVMRRMQIMCRRGYFSGHINFGTGRMELNTAPQGVSVEHCPGCGATTAISRTGDTCRYCGAPLKRTDLNKEKDEEFH